MKGGRVMRMRPVWDVTSIDQVSRVQNRRMDLQDLPPRKQEVFLLVGEGLNFKQVGERMEIGCDVAREYLYDVGRRWGLRNIKEIRELAYRYFSERP
jgi:DNA-binding NarL/FixJ family response regulator